MAIPAEFKYANEDEFIQKFLIPLLQRLGFSLVVNYHGHAEFGKDLVFAEIDRFGHVRYHGLQAKYESSISLNGVESLISDCKQAFSNPFTHPQTGTVERISSFYAINGGSLGSEAVQHYFNSLLPLHGGNARLLQAKDLLTLDRWASVNRTENITAVVNGLLLELAYNQNIIPKWSSILQKSIAGEKNLYWPIARFKVDATSAYLMQPILQNFLNTDAVLEYWELANTCNRVFATLMPGLSRPGNANEVMNNCLAHFTHMSNLTISIRAVLHQTLQTLGPLAAI